MKLECLILTPSARVTLTDDEHRLLMTGAVSLGRAGDVAPLIPLIRSSGGGVEVDSTLTYAGLALLLRCVNQAKRIRLQYITEGQKYYWFLDDAENLERQLKFAQCQIRAVKNLVRKPKRLRTSSHKHYPSVTP